MDESLRKIIDEICHAAQENNIGTCRFLPEDTSTICLESAPINGAVRDVTLLVTFNNNICYICNGYYGPSFGDPMCSTCHAFLYPIETASAEIPSFMELSGDSDSGNEEPDDGQESISTLDSTDGQGGSGMAILSPILHDNDALQPLVPVGGTAPLAMELYRLSVFSPMVEQVNIELLPPEVLMHMFSYLDEISLWSIGQVCTRWKAILFMCIKPDKWKQFTLLRWPLLAVRPDLECDWYELYTSMMLSSCCIKCIKQMAAQNCNWEECSWRRHRLMTELRAMRNDPLDGIEAKPLESSCSHWQATIEGPAGSPYEGGLFFLYIQVPSSYPLDPPVVRFLTKIFHPNVSRHGDIGLDSIHHNWSLALTISKLLISIQSLLTDPYCDVCMEPEIGRMYMKNRKAFEDQAKLWTIRYAMHDMLPH